MSSQLPHGRDDRRTSRREETEALAEFGRCFGMVYQLRDDILDLTATDNQLGKPAGQDLAEGIYNLPTLFAIATRASATSCARCSAEPLDDDDRERARKLVVASDGVDRTVARGARASSTRPTWRSRRCRASSCAPGFASLIASLLEDLPALLIAQAASASERRSPRGCSPRRRPASPGGPCRRRVPPSAAVPTRAP